MNGRLAGSSAGEPADATSILDTRKAGPAAIRGSALRIGGYAVGVALSVLSFAFLTRYLGVGDFGRYVTVFSLITIVGGVAEAGMTNIGLREYTIREGADREELMRNLLGIRLAVAGVGMLAAVAFALAAGYDGVMVAGTVIGGAGLLLIIVQQTYAVPLSVALRLGVVTTLDLVRQAVMLVLIVGLVLAGAALFAFFVIPVPTGLILLVATVALVRGHVPLRPAFSTDAWRKLAGLLVPFAAATAVGVIYVQLLVLLLSVISTDHETGIFGASFRVFFVLNAVPALLVSVAFPLLARAARDDRERFTYAIQRIFETNAILGGWFVLSTILGAAIAIDVIAGPKYHAAIEVLRIQGVALGATFLLATWAFALISLHRHRALLLANLLALVVTVGVGAALISSSGAHGAAIASIVGESSLAAGYAVALFTGRDRMRLSFRILPPVILAAGLGGALALIPGLPVVALVAAATVVYFGVLIALKAVPAELTEAFSQWRRGSG